MPHENTVLESTETQTHPVGVALSRRALLGTGAAAGAGLLLAGNGAKADILRSVRGFIDLNPLVVNFAFEMEELESDFFARCTTSKAYDALPLRARSAINQIALDDKDHYEAIAYLREKQSSKGSSQMESPNASSTRLGHFFNYPAGAFEKPETLLETAVTIKETCLHAYHGAVDEVDKETLKLAAAIAGVEGRHLAVLLEISGKDPVPASFEGAISSQKAGQILGRYGFRGGASGGSNNVVR